MKLITDYLRSITAAGALLLFAGCHGNEKKVELGYSRNGGAEDGTSTSTTSTAARPQERMEVIPVQVEEINSTIRLTGNLVADEESEVASQQSGIVKEVVVDRGSLVEKGDVLARLDSRDAENALLTGLAGVEELKVRLGIKGDGENFDPSEQPEAKAARSTFELASTTFKRDKELFEKKVIAKAEFDTSRTEYEAAKQRYELSVFQAAQLFQQYKSALVRLRSLRKAVEDTTITAPFTGMVVEKHISPGEMLMNMPMGGMGGSSVVTLVRIDPLRLELTVPAQHVHLVRPGQEVQFSVNAIADEKFTAKIALVSPSMKRETRSLAVEAVVENKERKLRPGMFAEARLKLADTQVALYVPDKALQRTGEVARVFEVRDGIAREQVVTVGESEDGRVRIMNGLTRDSLIVADADNIRDGVRVR